MNVSVQTLLAMIGELAVEKAILTNQLAESRCALAATAAPSDTPDDDAVDVELPEDAAAGEDPADKP